jgi:hypothetical protein
MPFFHLSIVIAAQKMLAEERKVINGGGDYASAYFPPFVVRQR